MTTLLALDPGGIPSSTRSRSATGYSLWYYDSITPLRPLEHGQIRGNEDHFIAWFERQDPFGIDEIVCESYRLDGRTPNPDVTPLKIEGALKAMCRPHGFPLSFQPNGMKGHLTDEKIKSLGLWWPGEPHAIDSMRHAWALLKVRQHMPTMLAAWPPRPRVMLFNSDISPDLRPAPGFDSF